LVLALAITWAQAAAGAGFAVDTQGARATGVGTAVVAWTQGPEAVFYNPAGLLGGGAEVALGGTLLAPLLRFEPEQGEAASAELTLSPPPHLYARYPLGQRVALGLGLFSPFGAHSRWASDWVGRFRTTGSSLATYVLNPSVAVQVHQRVKLGAGAQLVRGTVLLRRGINFVDSEGSVELGGGAYGLGYNAGAQLELWPERLSLGLALRSAVDLSFAGRADFTAIPAEFQGQLVDQGVRTRLRLPLLAWGGLAYRPTPDWTVGLDAHFTGWSSFPALELEFDDPAVSSRVPKGWRDVASVHLGAEFRGLTAWALRGGLVFDPTPSPPETLTPDLPDAHRLKLAVGAGWTRERLRVDGAYQLAVLLPTRSTSLELPGTYGGTAHVLGATVGYRW
jgi:long-chain fatty acid transport protein